MIGLGVGDRRHGRRRGPLVRPAVPLPLVPARQRQVRPDPAAAPRRAAADRRGDHRRTAADRRRLGQPGAGAGAGRAVITSPRPSGGRWPDCGVRQVFGVVGSGNFHVTNALVDGRRPVRRRPPRERRGDDGRRLRAHERHGRGGDGAPGLRADQRDDRHHRGRQEPHAAARPRRRGRPQPTVELLRRPDGLAAAVGAVPMRVTSRRAPPSPTRRAAYWTARARAPHRVLNLPLDVQAPRCRLTPRSAPHRPATPPSSGRRGRARPPRRRAARRPSGRCSSPGAARAAPAAGSRWSSWPSGAARCWRRAPSPTACSKAIRGRSASPAGSPHRSPPS